MPAPTPLAPATQTNSPATESSAVLVMIAGPCIGTSYPLRDQELTLGRTPDNAIVIASPAVSQQHARVVKRGDRYWILDFTSANGTYVNGVRVQHHALTPGDLVTIGPATFRFLTEAPSMPHRS